MSLALLDAALYGIQNTVILHGVVPVVISRYVLVRKGFIQSTDVTELVFRKLDLLVVQVELWRDQLFIR